MSKQTAEDMTWHKNKRTNDGILRHPADSLTWKKFDEEHTFFASDARNVRLGLASDGFNPFGIMSTSYSMWPVVLIPYNVPPWLCMKQSNFMLSLLISGPKSPGNDIDVFLQPLIDDLKELWNVGVETYEETQRQFEERMEKQLEEKLAHIFFRMNPFTVSRSTIFTSLLV
jgi:hypothetical protein